MDAQERVTRPGDEHIWRNPVDSHPRGKDSPYFLKQLMHSNLAAVHRKEKERWHGKGSGWGYGQGASTKGPKRPAASPGTKLRFAWYHDIVQVLLDVKKPITPAYPC